MPVFRVGGIAVEIARFGLALAVSHLPASKVRPSQQLCASLTRLGTTFSKFGQALSLRRDLLPSDYIDALQLAGGPMRSDAGGSTSKSNSRTSRATARRASRSIATQG